jgi:hypothetical protein
MNLRRVIFVLVSLVLLGFGTVSGLSREERTNPPADAVTGSGCVESGVEAGCLVLKDFKDKKLYSLHFPSGKKPGPGTAISFEGTKLDVDICMQGTPVAVIKWTALKTKCPKDSSKPDPKPSP